MSWEESPLLSERWWTLRFVMVENAHKRLSGGSRGEAGKQDRCHRRRGKEVGKPLFYSLLIITVSFLPSLLLEAQEEPLSRWLSQDLCKFFASFLSITWRGFDGTTDCGKILRKQKPVSRVLIAL